MKRSRKSGQAADFPRLIGVVHLPALAGAPACRGILAHQALQVAGLRAVQEGRCFENAGFGALILENFGDIPFYRDQVPPETIASLAVIAAAVREAVRIPIGINVLRNDARAALAIAAVTGCDFIRVNVLCGVAATDQGLVEGHAAELLRERIRLGAEHVRILADVQVKHARSLSGNDIGLAIEEAYLRAGADGVIVTGVTTGRVLAPADLERASQAARHCGAPLFLDSGATAEALSSLMPHLHGVIVSSSLRQGSRAGAPLDLPRVKAFAKAFSKVPRARAKRKLMRKK